MKSNSIPNGCIQLARVLLQSEIWQDKPSWWLKVWIYLLLKVNHQDWGKIKRGQNRFTVEDIYNHCNLRIENVKQKSVDNVLRWLKDTKQITKRKTTRGQIITICNYESYQNLASYENVIKNKIVTKSVRNSNEPIYNNDKNDKNEYLVEFNLLWASYKRKEGRSLALDFYSKARKNHTFENIKKALENYNAKLAVEKPESKFIKMGSTFFKDWEDYLDFEPPKPRVCSRAELNKKY